MLKLSNNLHITTVTDDTSLSLRNALEMIKSIPYAKDIETWKKIVESDKLRTYRKIKTPLGKEWYCILPLSRDHRRVLFNLRSCSVPLAIETGRYSKPKTPLNERLCKSRKENIKVLPFEYTGG